MIQATDYTFQNKWERDYGNISQHKLQKYNSMIKDLNEVALKDFQFKIIYKILVTKSFLQRTGKLAENQCSYCIEKPETLPHLFTECEKVNRFWQELRTWVFSHSNLYLNIDNKPIIFSQQNNILLVYISVVAKNCIYKNKFFNRDTNLNVFITVLKRKFQCKKYVAHINNSMSKFLKHLGSIVYFI